MITDGYNRLQKWQKDFRTVGDLHPLMLEWFGAVEIRWYNSPILVPHLTTPYVKIRRATQRIQAYNRTEHRDNITFLLLNDLHLLLLINTL